MLRFSTRIDELGIALLNQKWACRRALAEEHIALVVPGGRRPKLESKAAGMRREVPGFSHR
jgi:hypothetical protein